MAAKGGHNDESHNHNDVGNVVVYVDGKPVIVDAGVETYTRKTFSAERYTIWTMQSAYHTLPTIVATASMMQAPGRTFAARDATYAMDDASAHLSLDIAGAYPDEAKLTSWKRTVTLHRGKAWTSSTPTTWKHQRKPHAQRADAMRVDASAPGTARTHGSRTARRSQRRRRDADLRCGQTQRHRRGNCHRRRPQIGQVWGNRLFRILFTAQNPPQQDTWTLKVRR